LESSIICYINATLRLRLWVLLLAQRNPAIEIYGVSKFVNHISLSLNPAPTIDKKLKSTQQFSEIVENGSQIRNHFIKSSLSL
jgi:hypothetical protein